ncbi:MAG: hypothetical protein JXB39_07435 [Deltaproteobacteria bacterium]|nr:hypothetical protein [Deltaproteobacteria bacterium]
MSNPTPKPTLAAQVREAARSETAFLATLNEILQDEEPGRLEEFFTKLNIPRSSRTDDTLSEGGDTSETEVAVTTFEQEVRVAEGIQKFLDRHVRKLKWHVSHPTLDGVQNGIRLYRALAMVSRLRVRRTLALLESRGRLTVREWGVARELFNRAYREFREVTGIVTTLWVDALAAQNDREAVRNALSSLPEMVADQVRAIGELRDRIESRRQALEVKPDGYPAVRPPRYFGGDLLDGPSWKHFWGEVNGMADAARNTLGL